MDNKKLNLFSRLLTKICRHEAQNRGIIIRADGFIKLEDIFKDIDVQQFNPTLEDTQKAVAADNKSKKRTDLIQEEGVWIIRAIDGHTIPGVLE